MTTFQAIVFGVIHGFTEFLPISSSAHHLLVPYLLGWPVPEGTFAGALSLGALLALLVYFRHDWASMISSFLQVIIFRKKPMTLDERLPIFLLIATLPSAASWYYLHESASDLLSNPLWVAGSLAAFSLPLWLCDSMSRKNKGMFDWNWLDSLIVGIGQMLLLIPGCGRMTGGICGALFRNYNRDAAAKFVFFAAAPILTGSTFLHLRELDLHAAAPAPDTTWFTFVITVIVTLLAGLLAIGAFMKQAQRKGFRESILYRLLLAASIAIVHWVRSGHALG